MSNFRGKKTHLGMCDTRTEFSTYIKIKNKNLGTRDSPLQNKKFLDHQWQNVTNLHK